MCYPGLFRPRFRWVACQLDVLGSCLSPSVLDRTLKSLPRTLDETYERILLKVPEEYQQQAFSALQFLAFSLRPVSLDCIAEVIAFPPGCRDVDDMDRLFDSHDVLAICPSLITIQQNGNIAQLAHYSVKEWLMSPRTCRGPVKAFHLDFAKAHTELTNLCVDYVYLVHELRGVASLSQNFPLLAYAILQWSQHARLAENEGGTEQPALGTRLLSSMSSPVFNGWRRIYVNLETWDDQKPAFWSFAKRNPFERYTTPLSWAAFLDLPKTVQAFLDQGADVNDAVSSVYYTSLQAAAFHGRTHIVKILLDHGADINRKGTLGTALQSAFESRDPATINLLLERGADVNAQCGYYYSPLQFALAQSMPDFVPKLVSLGANVNLTGGHFGTALQAAAARGQEAAVDILIKHGANYITHCGLYGNPLQAASQAGHATVVHRLLDAGADPNAAGGRYRNAFHAALAMRVSSKNRKEILEMLVAAGARPPVDSLMIAIQGNMDANIIKIILDHDVTVVAQRHAIQSDAQLSQFDDDLRSSSMELYLLEPWFRPEEYDDFWKRYEHCLAEDVKNRLRLYDQRRREVELRHQHVSE
ncbi:hypothetical protein MMC25_006812 [Agyrium rufum]|nr:hypothetical protein [Agyrium rufum]